MCQPSILRIGPIALNRDPVLHLDYGLLLPLSRVPVRVLAVFDLPEHEAEFIARESSTPGLATNAQVRSWGLHDWDGPFDAFRWSFLGKVYLLGIEYPSPFIAAMTWVSGSHSGTEEDGYFEFFDRDAVMSLTEAAAACALDDSATIYDEAFRGLVEAELEEHEDVPVKPVPDAEGKQSHISSPCPYRLAGNRLFWGTPEFIGLSDREARCLSILLSAPDRRAKFVQHKDNLPNYPQHFTRIKKKLKKKGAPDHIDRPGNKGSGTADGAEYALTNRRVG